MAAYPAFGDVQLRLITRDAVQRFSFREAAEQVGLEDGQASSNCFRDDHGSCRDGRTHSIEASPQDAFPRRGPVKEKAVIGPEKTRELLDVLPEPSASLARLGTT